MIDQARRGVALADVQHAIGRATRFAHHCQKKAEDLGPQFHGAWRSPGDLGPVCTAQTAITLWFVGSLDPHEGAGIVQYLCNHQRVDGSFGNHPWAPAGDVCATASAWAAMRVLGMKETAGPVQRAYAFIAANGGLAEVARRLIRMTPDALFVGMAGLLDPGLLIEVPVAFDLSMSVERAMQRGMSYTMVYMSVMFGVLVRHLRDDWGSHRTRTGWLASTERQRAIELVTQFMNPNGSYNDILPQSNIVAAGLFALGLTRADPLLKSVLDWIQTRKRSEPDDFAIFYSAFPTTIWSTAYWLRALIISGTPRDADQVTSAVRFLLKAQVLQEPPALVRTKPGAPRSGGWAFEDDNPLAPDADDTAVVLDALGLVVRADGDDALPEPLASEVRAAIGKAEAWMLGMQNPDGGWPAYEYGLPGKPRGPIMLNQVGPHAHHDSVMLAIGDPATEDVTARALIALGQLGYTVASPVVARAIEFLKAQQCMPEQLGGGADQGAGGAWWSRWICGYLAATAYVLRGLAGVGQDLTEPWVQRAIAWVKLHQNPDGGWGEDAIVYEDPSQAGIGHSSPALTGLVLLGLMHAGEGACPEIGRGIAYLIEHQLANGRWLFSHMLHVFYKTNTLYTFPAADQYYPLESLGHYYTFHVGEAARMRTADGRWNVTGLEAMRRVGDPDVDPLVQSILSDGSLGGVNDLMQRIVRSDDPVPAGLPAQARAYFDRPALPAWIDPARVRRAQRLFREHGVTAAAILFYSSLPRAYASANGARVLRGTGGLTVHAQRRVFETAQFLFDVMDEGALGPDGRGVRAAQKLRLLHGAIRHLTSQTGDWDPAWGVPINQEDLASTLMTFSHVLLDGWHRLGVRISDADADAWIHTWNVVGHVMGIRDDLMPRDARDGGALFETIVERQWAASKHGHALATALIDVLHRMLRWTTPSSLPVSMMRLLAGDRCCDLLRLPPASWTQSAVGIVIQVEARLGHAEHDSRLHMLGRRAAFDLMKAIVTVEREGKQTQFRIPATLVHAWNLKD